MSLVSEKGRVRETYKCSPEKWTQQARMLSIVGWVVPSDDELKFSESAGKAHRAWIHQQFRYCPICLQHAYHSYLHQLIPLKICPLHSVMLTTACSNCGRANLALATAPELFNRPYRCPHCELPISGTDKCWARDDHEDFRGSQEHIERAFQSIAQWWREGESIRPDISKFIAARYSGLYSFAYDDTELLRSMLAVRVPPVADLAGPKYPAMTELSWRLRLRRSEGRLHLDRSTHFAWNAKIKLGTSLPAYQCAVRMIERWIGVKIEMHGAAAAFTAAASQTAPAKRLQLEALAHMKEQLGDRMRTATQLYDMPKFQYISYENRTQRMGWLAQYFALYAAWYHFLSRNRSTDEWNRFGAQLKEATGIYCFIEKSGENSSGRVTFPYIEGFSEMCMKRFKYSQHQELGRTPAT